VIKLRKNKKYESLYRINSDTGRVIIDIALDDYLEFFHEWDNSTFKKRDMHPELAEFLDICSEDIPIRRKLEIVFSIGTARNLEKEELIRTSYRNYYNAIKRLEDRKTKRFIRLSAILLFTSLMLLSVYALLADFRESNIVSKVLLESLLIGGWVFTWEAVHMLFLDIIEPFHRRREIKRFLETELSFNYQ
jgi:hypothetical protein